MEEFGSLQLGEDQLFSWRSWEHQLFRCFFIGFTAAFLRLQTNILPSFQRVVARLSGEKSTALPASERRAPLTWLLAALVRSSSTHSACSWLWEIRRLALGKTSAGPIAWTHHFR